MRLLLTALALAATTAAQAPVVTTLLANGTTQTRYDMVILADGYQAFEQALFNTDCQNFLTALFSKQPYQTFAAYYNVHTVFRASVESGADHPDAVPPIWRNTVYNASYNTGGVARCLYIGNTSQALADAALAPANEGRVLVMVNDSRYGGCAGTFAVSYNGGSMTEVQIHELGHSLGSLADEYEYVNTTYSGGEPAQKNITTSPVGQKWSHWWGTDGISAFEGAGYNQFGLWRPKNNCLMRSLGVALCAVCKEQIAKVTNSIVDTIHQFTPATSSVMVQAGTPQTFTIGHFVPAGNNPLIAWKVDGTIVPGATSTTFLFDPSTVALGVHTVEASVQDQSAIVRLDPTAVMRETQTWQVTVSDPTAAQLRIPAFSSSLVWVVPGTPVVLSATIRNDGPASAGSFAVEYFLSPTQPWTTQSIYLGGDTVPSLGMGQQVALQHAVSLPWRLEPRVYYLYCVVDRLDVVHESFENDNERISALVCQAGPCVTKLEYDDALLCPYDTATVSIATGGTVHPTVIARCAAPGTMYLIVWGGSGTSPGTTLAPGLTVPINQDFLTQLGLATVNGAWFQSFFGVLDAQGLGRATFVLPAATGLPVTPGHFAALLVDPALGFTAVSNPVSILLGP